MFTTLNIAHKWSKIPHFYKMLTTGKNAHNSWKCSQLLKMLTTLENAHNAWKCSQRLKITIYKMQTKLDTATIFEIAYNTGYITLPTDALTSLYQRSQLWVLIVHRPHGISAIDTNDVGRRMQPQQTCLSTAKHPKEPFCNGIYGQRWSFWHHVW